MDVVLCPDEGTVIHGTLVNFALIRAFYAELSRVWPSEATAIRDASHHSAAWRVVLDEDCPHRTRFYVEQNQCDAELLNDLFDSLDEAGRPFGFHFGAHEGDGADFGWWVTPDYSVADEDDDDPLLALLAS